MFHSLDEQIRRGQGRTAAIWNRMLQLAGVLVVTGVIFGGLLLRHTRPGVSHPPAAPAIGPIQSSGR